MTSRPQVKKIDLELPPKIDYLVISAVFLCDQIPVSFADMGVALKFYKLGEALRNTSQNLWTPKVCLR